MSSDKPVIFISCGQFTQQEKTLGKRIESLVNDSGVFRGYFAENQSSLEGVTNNIFAQLDKCFGLVCVMHNRGTVRNHESRSLIRASVWIEQEIGIAAFLTAVFKRDIKTRVYMERGINREGVRDKVIVNPMEFESNEEVLMDLPTIINLWAKEVVTQKGARFRQELIGLLEELSDNRKLLAKELSNHRLCSDNCFQELKKTRVLDQFGSPFKETIKEAYDDCVDYNTSIQTLLSLSDITMARSNHEHSQLGPAKVKASKSVGKAKAALDSLLAGLHGA